MALQGRPEESHGGKRPYGQLLPLGAVVVGEEGEALRIQPLEQQDAAMRAPLFVNGRQGHGVGLDRRLLGFHRLCEPLVEQREGLDRSLGFGQSVTGVVAAHVRQSLGHCWFLLPDA